MSTPNGAVYKIVQPRRVLDQLQELHQNAKAKGSGSKVALAVRRIFGLLETDPVGFGEPRFSLPHAGLEVRVGAMAPVLIVYGVHPQRRIVFIRDFLPLPELDS